MFGKPWGEVVSDCIVKTPNGGEIATLQCIPAVFLNVLWFAIGAAGVVAVIFIIYAGFRYVTSSGDQKRVDSARKTLTWAIIGLILILLSYFIVSLIGVITGTEECITVFGFDNEACR